MGSPNFNTSTDSLNVALDRLVLIKRGDMPDYDTDEDDSIYQEFQEHIQDAYQVMEEFIQKLPHLYFHHVVVEDGYIEGFQAYIKTEYRNYDAYVTEQVRNWDNYQEFFDFDGNLTCLQDCPYLPRNVKNLTYFNLERAIDKEHKTLHNLLLKKAKEIGLGEVCGSGFTSYTTYPIKTTKI